MCQAIVSPGASELSYEIREIVKKADELEGIGQKVYWENIGDPLQKNWKIPIWMKDIIAELVYEDKSYGYSHSMGGRKIRQYIAAQNNKLNGAKINADDIIFF